MDCEIDIIEIWKPVVGFPWYEVSNFGNVRSVDREIEFIQRNQFGSRISVKRLKGRPLKPKKAGMGYLSVCVSRPIGGGEVSVSYKFIHRLVAEAFIGCIDGMEVNHKDGNKLNNREDNLEIVDRVRNQDHAFHTGLNTLVKPSIAVYVDGVHYKSLGQAAKSLGVSIDTLKNRLDGNVKNPRHKFNIRYA